MQCITVSQIEMETGQAWRRLLIRGPWLIYFVFRKHMHACNSPRKRYPSSLTSLPYCICVLLEGHKCYRVWRGKLFLQPSFLTSNCTFRCSLTNTSHRSCQFISGIYFPSCSTKSAMKNLQWRFQKYFSDMLIQV